MGFLVGLLFRLGQSISLMSDGSRNRTTQIANIVTMGLSKGSLGS